MSKLRKLLKSEQGISLIEVVASIVIIGIILISFFGLFIQSNKTGKTSETIIEATYKAQVEMEKIYDLSKTKVYADLEDTLISRGYAKVPDNNIEDYTKEESPYTIHLSFTNRTSYSNLKNVVVTIFEDGVEKSKMENIYKWR